VRHESICYKAPKTIIFVIADSIKLIHQVIYQLDLSIGALLFLLFYYVQYSILYTQMVQIEERTRVYSYKSIYCKQRGGNS
jgi:hypothetical protein